MKAKLLFCYSLVAALAALAMPDLLLAANVLVVNKIQDSSDGSCDVADCSLREAMAAAQLGDSIEFSALFSSPQTIVLNGTNLVFSSNVTLRGPGRDLLTISGNQQSRIFLIPFNYSVAISDLSIRNGFTTGSGGGISATGHLDLRNATISQNRANEFGSGILAEGSYNISNATISENQSQLNGAICICGDSSGFIRDSIIVNNIAARDGGGIYVESGTLTLISSTVGANSAARWGGGIYSFFSVVNVYESTITGNTANGPNTASGLDNTGGTVEVRNSTFSGNTIASDSITGGALWTGGTARITSSTFTENSAPAGAFSASGIYHSSGTLTIRNSIVAGNSHVGGAKDVTSSAPESLTSQGYNLIGDSGSLVFNAIFDQVGSSASPLNPMLLPLANNGGPTLTHAPQTNSPILDRGFSFALTSDQRGSRRPEDDLNIPNASDGADIGAYEAFNDIIFKNGFDEPGLK